MNTSHRSLWNSALGAWVAVSEFTRARGTRSGGASTALTGGSVLALGLLLLSTPALAGGDGGYGGAHGNVNDSGGASSGSGASTGGNGGLGYDYGIGVGGLGGTGGGNGGNGADGGAVGGGGGGGGGGGNTGQVITIDGTNNTTLINGFHGGRGGLASGGRGGGGGGGGAGVAAGTAVANVTNSSGITGGNGGSISTSGGAGGGGAGVVAASGLVNFSNSGTIQGGNGGSDAGGGSGGSGGSGEGGAAGGNRSGTFGQGGAGIIGKDMSIINSGSISGGWSNAHGPGSIRANAITFTGGNNSLTLKTGSALTGAIEIRSGAAASIVAGDAGLTVNNAILLGGNGTVDTNGKTFAVSGAVSGTGSLTKTGAGTLTLSGGNTYGGATTISAGTLQAGAHNTLSANSALTLVTGATLNLSNFNQTIGSLAGGGNVSLGTADFNVGGDNTSTTYGGVISGSAVPNLGRLVKQGNGTLTLIGANTYSGGTSVNAGVLQGNSTSLQGDIINNAAVTFDQGTTGSYAGVMSGTGSLTKTGSGNLILTGINTLSGATSINAGTLSVNGSIASGTTINSGGTLGGNGTVGNAIINAGGVLAPGNSIGLLTVNGNATFAAGSTYRVEVDAAGNNDRTNVTGTAALNGTMDVQAAAGTYVANTRYTLLNATGGVTGRFAGLSSNLTHLAFLTPTLGYDANNVFLNLARNGISFSGVAQTPNQIAISAALQNAITGASGDMRTVVNAVTSMTAEQARAAYDSVGGNSLVGLRGAGASFAAGFGNQMQARMGAMQNSSAGGQINAFSNRPVLLAANDHVSDLMTPATVSDSPQKFSLAGGGAVSSNLQSKNDPANGFWLRGSGGYQDTRSDGNAGASKVRNSGLSAGFDTELREGLRAGVALSGGSADLSTDSQTSGKSRGSAVALYGSYASGPWNVSGYASLAYGRNHMDRTVTVGAINRVATSDFDSRTLSAYGEAAYSMAMTGGWTLQPLAGLSLSRSKADGFTEAGAGALNLQVAGQTTTSTKSLLGAKAAFEAGSVRLEPRVIWAHEFGDLNTPMTAQFQGAANASPFQVSGVALKRDTLILGLGASGSISKGIDLFADVQAEHNSRQNNLAALVGLRVRW